jgi:hypothetical protein
MRISVVICTWNRADELRTTLDSLTQLVIPAGCVWELVVVDNGSTDETNTVIAEFEARLPVRSLFEPELGLSRARNRGAAAARGGSRRADRVHGRRRLGRGELARSVPGCG